MFPTKFMSFYVAAVFVAPLLSLPLMSTALAEPNSRPLADYSNEEIVKEYHRRIDQFNQEIAVPFVDKISSAYDESDVPGMADRIQITDEEVIEVLSKTLEFSRPFAEAGDLDSMTFVGRTMMDDLDPKVRCDGYSMLRSAAVDGFLGAIAMLSTYYLSADHSRARLESQNTEKLMFLWSRESLHRSPDMFAQNFKIISDQISKDKLDQYEQEWIEWSPEHAPLKLGDDCP